MDVDVLLPVKPLAVAKTRLLGAADAGGERTAAHRRLVLALLRDTVDATAAATAVRRVVVICSDRQVRAALASASVSVLCDEPGGGLNNALRYGESWLRAAGSRAPMAALQADLPALRPEELTAAVRAGLSRGGRTFCPDRSGTGTTLLLAVPPVPLLPRFGPRSAAAHAASGAVVLSGCWPGLRCDVDTPADLVVAREYGLGRFTRAALTDQGTDHSSERPRTSN